MTRRAAFLPPLQTSGAPKHTTKLQTRRFQHCGNEAECLPTDILGYLELTTTRRTLRERPLGAKGREERYLRPRGADSASAVLAQSPERKHILYASSGFSGAIASVGYSAPLLVDVKLFFYRALPLLGARGHLVFHGDPGAEITFSYHDFAASPESREQQNPAPAQLHGELNQGRILYLNPIRRAEAYFSLPELRMQLVGSVDWYAISRYVERYRLPLFGNVNEVGHTVINCPRVVTGYNCHGHLCI